MENLAASKNFDDDLIEPGKELFGHHGVSYRNTNMPDDEPPTEGSLSVVQYSTGKCIEWKPSEVSELSDCLDQEWTMVNTVRHRSRTLSGSTEAWRQQHIKIPFSSIKGYKVLDKKTKLILIPKNSNVQHHLYFKFGNSDGLTQILKSFITSKRSKIDKNYYLVLSDKAGPIPRSFSDLSLVHNSGDGAWNLVSIFKEGPYEKTMSTFSKFTGIFPGYRLGESRPSDEDEIVGDLSSSTTTDGGVGSTGGPGGIAEEDEYAMLASSAVDKLPPRPLPERGPSLNTMQWAAATDSEGRIIDPDGIKKIIFRGGVQPSLRYDVWKFLLGYYPWDSTHSERLEMKKQRMEDYIRMKLQWKSLSPEQEARFSPFRERKTIIEKDVYRTDRTVAFFAGDNNPNLTLLSDILMTYVMYNFDLGYVQGMSDLLSPILALMSNEVDAFWCFVGFMQKIYRNFDEDQAGMKKQLSQLYTLLCAAEPQFATHLDRHGSGNMFFCFRWLLVWFKREFSHDNIMHLWEVLWTGLPCSNFHLLICVAILESEQKTIIERDYGLNETLKHFNDLSYCLDVENLLRKAEGIYIQLSAMENLTTTTKRVLGLGGGSSGASEACTGNGMDSAANSSCAEDDEFDDDQDSGHHDSNNDHDHHNNSSASNFCCDSPSKNVSGTNSSGLNDALDNNLPTMPISGLEKSYEVGLSFHYS